MNQHKNRDVSEYFVLVCKKNFHFLEKEFLFKHYVTIFGDGGVTVTYKSDKAAIVVSLNERHGGILVDLIRLKDNQIPDLPIEIDKDTKLNEFDFEDLLTIRNRDGKIEKPDLDDLVFNAGREKIIGKTLKQYAMALHAYAKDILRGDFEVFNKLEEIVKKRIKRIKTN